MQLCNLDIEIMISQVSSTQLNLLAEGYQAALAERGVKTQHKQSERLPKWDLQFKKDSFFPTYLKIRPVALSGYGSIAHEAKPNGLLSRGPKLRVKGLIVLVSSN